MKFHRIDEETVQCNLSEEEIKEQGLEIEDFFENKNKVRGFLEEVIQRAHEEIGYESTSQNVSLQISPLPGNGLAITFFENSEDSFKQMLKHVKDVMGKMNEEEIEHILEESDMGKFPFENKKEPANGNIIKSEPDFMSKERQKATRAEFKKRVTTLLYEMKTLDQVLELAKVLPEIAMKTSLYYDLKQKKYYFIMIAGKPGMKEFNTVAATAREYGTEVHYNSGRHAYIKEHMHAIMKKNALHTLKEMMN